MKKFLVALLTVTAITSIFVGCSSPKEDIENKVNQEEVQKDQYNSEENIYSGLLNSGKTYEEMTVEERTMFSTIADSFDNFTQEFKDKYREVVNKIKATKDEAMNKLNDKKEDIKEKENKIEKRENLIGKSDKDFSGISTSASINVPNDKTGNWRIVKVSTPEDIVYYAKSYADKNIKNSNEIHGIVNTETNTTIALSKMTDNILTVTVHKYTDGEELDANKLFGGEVINEYWIYMDNGDIEKIE